MNELRRTRFSPSAFIRGKALFLAGSMLFIVLLTLVLIVLEASTSGIIFIDLIAVMGVTGYLILQYARRASFWHQVEEATTNLEQGAHVVDLVDEPSFLEGRLAYEAALAIVQADNQGITELKSNARENAEYIELWVHEVKTPLSAAKLITKRMSGADAFALRRELERMDDLISQSLFAARTESLVADYLIREVNLADIAKEVCKSHMHYLTSLGVTIDFQIDPDTTVFADKMWLEFIITQIVVNAAKYDAHLVSFAAFEAQQESSTSSTVLEIKDDGCGIPAEDVPRVFDRGFTGAVGRAHGSATGMGLYLVARMCARMGLSIMLASEEGIGTRVQIAFPHDRRRALLEKSNLTKV